MRLLLPWAISIICMAVRSNAENYNISTDIGPITVDSRERLYYQINESHAFKTYEPIVISDARPTSRDVNIRDLINEQTDRQAVAYLLERAGPFLKKLLTTFGNDTDSFVVSPMTELLSVATRNINNPRVLLDYLGLADPEGRQLIRRGLYSLIKMLKGRITVLRIFDNNRDDGDNRQQTTEGLGCLARLRSTFRRGSGPVYHRPTDNPERECVVGSRYWNIEFNSTRMERGTFYGYDGDSRDVNFVRTSLTCLYGKFNGTTYVLLTTKEGNDNALFIDFDDEERYRSVKRELGEINIEDLRARLTEREIDLLVPELRVETKYKQEKSTFEPWFPSHRSEDAANWWSVREFYASFGLFSGDGLVTLPGPVAEIESTESHETEGCIRVKLDRPFIFMTTKPKLSNLNLVTVVVGGKLSEWSRKLPAQQ